MARTSAKRAWISVFFGILGGLIAIALLVVLCMWMLSRSRPADREPHQPVYSREEFSSRVVGKSEEQILQEMGRPDFTSQDGESLYWHYRNRTRDPDGKGTDSDAQLVFHDGKVSKVNY